MKNTQKIYAVVTEPGHPYTAPQTIECLTTNSRLAVLVARFTANRDTSKRFSQINVLVGRDGDICPDFKLATRIAPYRTFRVSRDPTYEWKEVFKGKPGKIDPFKLCEKGKQKACRGKLRILISKGGVLHRFSQDVSLKWVTTIVHYLQDFIVLNDRGEKVDPFTGQKFQAVA